MSVGHVARVFEESGLSTVIVAVKAFQGRLETMHVPRALITPHLMGRPLGRPGDDDRQRQVVQAALALLESASQAGTIKEFNP